MALRSLLAALVLCLGCAESTDPRFASPEATIDTLLAAYGLGGVSEAAVRERLASRGRFILRDPGIFRACFADYAGPSDEGLAGYVLGSVGAAKDSLSIEVEEGAGRARVRLGDAPNAGSVVLRRRPDGWRVVLAESVPAGVRAQLRAVHRRAEARLRLGS